MAKAKAKAKAKTRSAVKKRFKLSGKGSVKRHKGFTSHLQGSKNRKRKRSLKKAVYLSGKIAANIKSMM